MNRPLASDRRILTIAAFGAAGIFAADLSLPLGVAGGVPYIVIVFAALWSPPRRDTLVAAAIVTLLTLIGLVLSPHGGELWKVLFNRALAIFAIWVTATLGLARKRAAEELRLQAEIAENIAEGVNLTRVCDGAIVYTNSRFDSMFGYAPGELVGKHFTVINAPGKESPEDTARRIIKSLKTDGVWSGEVHNIRKNGTPFWCHANVSTFEHPHHGTVWISVHEDITHRKQAEESLRRYEQIVSGAHEFMSFIDRDYVYQAVNDKYLEAFGKRRDEIIGRSVKEVLGERTFEGHVKKYMDLCLAGHPQRYQFWLEFPALGRRFLDVAYSPYFDPDGSVSGIVVTARDETERKQDKEALQAAELRYRTLFEQLPDAVVILDPNSTLPVEFSDQAPRLLGYSRQEFAKLKIADLEAAESPEETAKHIDKVLRQGRDEFETRLRTKHGEVRDIRISIRVVEIDGRKVFHGLLRDITDRKRAEEALRLAQFTVERTTDGIYWVAPDARFFYVNDAACRTLGYTRKELLSMRVHDIDPNYPESVWAGYWRETRERGSFTFESRNRRKDGSVFPVEINVSHFDFDGNRYNCAFVRDITDRKRAEEALRDQNLALANAMPGISRLDTNGRYVRVNEIYAGMMGYVPDELIGNDWTPTVHPEDRPRALEAYERMLREGKGEFEARGVRKDSTEFYKHVMMVKMTDELGTLVGHHCFMRDITERKQAEEHARRRQAELAHALRVSTMGEMAAGLAHELNQPLAALVNYTSGCLRRIDRPEADPKAIRDAMQRAAEQAHRAARILRRMGGFVRKQEAGNAPVDANALARDVMELVTSETKRARIDVRLELEDPAPLLRADSIQIEQVLLNLVRNALEAMKEVAPAGRELTITTSQIGADQVAIAVADTGPGLPPDTAEKIFNPFFTSKPQGLGMGLSISRSIIEAQGGRLDIVSNSGRGVAFRFLLPFAGTSRSPSQPSVAGA